MSSNKSVLHQACLRFSCRKCFECPFAEVKGQTSQNTGTWGTVWTVATFLWSCEIHNFTQKQ